MKSKKIIAFVCALAMVGTGVPFNTGLNSDTNSIATVKAGGFGDNFQNPIESGDFTYGFNEDNEAVIARYIGKESHVTVPAVIDGIKVAKVGDYAFRDCESVTSVEVEKGIKVLGRYTFSNCKNLKSVIIPDGVTEIMDYTFRGCESLSEVNIPSSVEAIGFWAFKSTAWLANKRKDNPLVIVNGILIDGVCCEGKIEIPDSVKVVNSSAFYPGKDEFSNMDEPDVCKITEVVMPATVTYIDSSAFESCIELEKVVIQGKVTNIEERAFFQCEKLTDINIPETVLSIGKDAFSGTPWYEKKSESNKFVIINGILIGIPVYQSEIIVPDEVTALSGGLFGYTGVEKVILPENLKIINTAAFMDCDTLSEIELPQGLNCIESAAFLQSGLKKIVIPKSVTKIGESAFAYCGNLKKVELSENIKTLEDDIFGGCFELEEINIPYGIEVIGSKVASGCPKLTSVTIPDSVTSIGTEAFLDCESLNNVFIPETVKSIGNNAFGIKRSFSESGTSYNVIKTFSISGVKGSAAEKYAAEKGIPFTSVAGGTAVTEAPVTTAAVKVTEVSVVTTAVKTTSVPVTTTEVKSTEVPVTTIRNTEITLPVTTAEEKSSVVSVGSINGKVGETVKVPVSIKNNPGIIAVVADIKFDGTALKLKGAEKNKEFWASAEFMPGSDMTSQPYRIVCSESLAKSDFKEDGTICELSFEILKEGSHPIELTVSENDTINFNLSSVKVNSANGVIKVSDSSETPSVTETPVTTPAAVTTAVSTVTTVAVTTPLSTTTVKSTEVPVTTTAAVTKTEVPVTTVTTPVTSSSVTENDEMSCVVSVGSINGKVGETVKVPVSIKNNPGIIAVVADIKFDGTALKLKGAEKNKEFWPSAEFMPGSDMTSQPYRIVCSESLAKSDFKEDGTICEISFEILKEGSHAIELTVSKDDTLNYNLSGFEFKSANGMINVSASPASTTAAVTEAPVITTGGQTTVAPVTTSPAPVTTAEVKTTEAPVTTIKSPEITLPDTTIDEKSSVVSAGSVNGKVGDTVKVPVSIRNNPGIISVVADIKFDGTALKLKGAEKNKDFWSSAEFIPGSDMTSQPFRIICSDSLAKSDFTEDGTICELTFEILKEGSHAIELSVSENDTLNYNLSGVEFKTAGGSVKTSGEENGKTEGTVFEIIKNAVKSGEEVFDEQTSALAGASEIKLNISDKFGFAGVNGTTVKYTFSLSDYKPDVENFEYAAFGLDLPEGFTVAGVDSALPSGTKTRSALSKLGPSLRRFVFDIPEPESDKNTSSIVGKVRYTAPGTSECAALDKVSGKASKDGYIIFSVADTKNATGNTDMFTVTLNVPAMTKMSTNEINVSALFGLYTEKTETADDGTVLPHVSLIVNNAGEKVYTEKKAKYITGLRGDVDLDGKVSQIDANVILKEILAHDAGTTVLPAEINMEAAGENSQALSRFLGDIDSSDNGEMFRQTDANAILKAILQADAAGEKEISENTWKKVLDVE